MKGKVVKMRTQLFLLLSMVFLLAMSASVSAYSGGTGEPNDPYLIETPNDLNSIGLDPCDWDKHFKMTADINLAGFTGTQFNIIGNSTTKFAGVFDGNGHTISNFTYSWDDAKSYIALFGYISGENSQIKNTNMLYPHVQEGSSFSWDIGCLVGRLEDGSVTNCHIYDGSIRGSWAVGGLVGYSKYGNVSACCATVDVVRGVGIEDPEDYGYNKGPVNSCNSAGSVSASWNSVGTGGLIGNHHTGMVTNCNSTSSVSGNQEVGGLIGLNQASISNCYSTGGVSGYWWVGGLVGNNDGGIVNPGEPNRGVINNSYSVSEVSGNSRVGGLVGVNTDGGAVYKCYSIGSVTGDTHVGGILGWNFEGAIDASFWDTETSDCNVSDGGTGLSTAEMQTMTTFTDAGWDFVNIWDLTCEEMNYPRLIWQITPVDYLCPHGVDFKDYSFFANYWQDTNCSGANDCDGTDLDFSDAVDANDLRIFCDHWLEGV